MVFLLIWSSLTQVYKKKNKQTSMCECWLYDWDLVLNIIFLYCSNITVHVYNMIFISSYWIIFSIWSSNEKLSVNIRYQVTNCLFPYLGANFCSIAAWNLLSLLISKYIKIAIHIVFLLMWSPLIWLYYKENLENECWFMRSQTGIDYYFL